MSTIGFRYLLLDDDGEPADPGVLVTLDDRWQVGDVFMAGGGRRFRILDMEPSEDELRVFRAVWTVEPFPD